MLDACARLGLDADRILQSAGLDAATVQDPDARIPRAQVSALWEKAYALSGDPNLALHAVEVLPFGAYRVFDFLAANAPTVGAALAKVADYFPLINDAARLPYTVGDDVVTLAVEIPSSPVSLTRPYAEYTLAAVYLCTRRATRQPFRLQRVEFTHSQPEDVSEHERIFGCPVRFGAEACQLLVARQVWDTPCDGSDLTLFSVLEDHARMLLDRLPEAGDLVGRVRSAIEVELRGGNPKLESIARQLAMSPRTLQRRLKGEGIVFNDLLDEIRFRAAKAYLAQRDVAGAEIAYLLGFGDQSAFTNAFKRWSGQTPSEYRRRKSAG